MTEILDNDHHLQLKNSMFWSCDPPFFFGWNGGRRVHVIMDLLEGANLNSWTSKSRLSIQVVLHKKVFSAPKPLFDNI